MSPGSPPTDDLPWRQLFRLGEQLIHLNTPDNQCRLIEETASSMLKGNAQVWLAETAYHFPGIDKPALFPPHPSNAWMRKAYETRSLQVFTPPEPTNQNLPDQAPLSIAVPLITQDVNLGVLYVERQTGPAFQPADVDFLERLAGLVSVVLQVTRQAAIKNWRFEQLSLVRSVSARIANIQDLDELSHQVVQLIQDTFRYYAVVLYTLEPGEKVLHFRALASSSDPSLGGLTPPAAAIRLGDGIVGYAAETGEELLAADTQKESRYRPMENLPDARSEIALPLKLEHRILGVLDVKSIQVDAFHEMDILVLRALADNIALAVESIHLFQDLRKRAEQLSLVAEVSRAITSILDPDMLLNEVAELIHTRFGYPFVHLFSVHAGRQEVIYQAGSGPRSQILREQAYTINLDDPVGMIAWVARNGKTLLANDVKSEPLYRPAELPPVDTQSEMAVPLLFGGQVLGVLDIQSTKVDAFTEEDRFLFEALADNISVAVRNARLYQSERWRRQVAESLRDIAGMLTSAAGPDEVLDAILTELERILPCTVAALWLLDETYQPGSDPGAMMLKLAAIHGGNHQDVEQVKAIAPDKFALIGEVVSTNQTRVRTAQDPVGPLGTALGYALDYSAIMTPLRVGDRPLGVLALAHPTSGRYGSEAQAMTAAFASYAAVAIENHRLYASTQEQAWVATVMLQVAEATQALNSVDELLSTVARLTPMLAGVRSCSIFLFDPDSQAFTLGSQYGLDPNQAADYEERPVRPGEAAAFDQLRELKTQVFLHHNPPAVRGDSQTPGALGHNPLVLFPLVSRGEMLGAFVVEHHHHHVNDERGEAFSEHQMAILLGIVQHTTIAVENIHLLESKQEDAYVTAVLLQVAQAVVSFNELDDILETILNILPILVGIDASVIYLWNQDIQVFQPKTVAFGSWMEDGAVLERSFTPEEYPLLQAVFEQDAMVVCDLGTIPEGPGRWHARHLPPADQDIRTLISREQNLLLGFPLSVKGQVLGVLLAQDASAASENRLRRFEIINGVAQQAALAIENDRLTRERLDRERLEREFQLARQIQQSFLPESLPLTPGWEFDVRWRTARQVGGDFYDCFPLPGDRIGLVIADVSDKGMAAALYMTVARTLIRAASRETESPADALARVNNLLLMDAQSGMFVTAVYAVVSLSSGEMVYSVAGHNLPLYIGVNHPEVVPLHKGGVALGVIEDVHLKDHRITLQPGDSIVFYTDGVTEAFVPPDQTYGETELVGVLTTCKGLTAAVVLEEVDRSLSDFLGEFPPSDDVTLLAIHRCSG